MYPNFPVAVKDSPIVRLNVLFYTHSIYCQPVLVITTCMKYLPSDTKQPTIKNQQTVFVLKVFFLSNVSRIHKFAFNRKLMSHFICKGKSDRKKNPKFFWQNTSIMQPLYF